MKPALFISAFLALPLVGCEQSGGAATTSPGGAPASVEVQEVQPGPIGTALPKEPESALSLAIRRAGYATTKLRFSEAAHLLKSEVGPEAARARAHLAIYQADCTGALALLQSASVRKSSGGQDLFKFAERCSHATTGSLVIEDKEAGVWIRLQDDRDRVLAPLLTDVASRALSALGRDLGVDLPRPLRIDLVRDLFSLSSVSGLPLEAAETTGTVAVARWGRVTMVSPRAMSDGFPWADTLAHEITHLILSYATAERAPLWLQEGLAKRAEHRWREAQAFDDAVNFSRDSYEAQIAGKSVGVDAIGPSIAMLPSAEAASIAFAEVTAFIDYWIEQNGTEALSLLLRDVEVAADADAAMRSVSGYGVADWQRLWRKGLEERYRSMPASEEHSVSDLLGPRALMRSLRLVELLTVDGYPGEAAELGAPDLDRAPHSSSLRFLLGKAAQLSKRDDVELLLGQLDDVDSAQAGWLALHSARLSRLQSNTDSVAFMKQAQGLDPLLVEVACGGASRVGSIATLEPDVMNGDATGQFDQELCKEALSLPVRGSR